MMTMMIMIIVQRLGRCSVAARHVTSRHVTSHHNTAWTSSVAKPQAKDAKPSPEIALLPPAAMLCSGHWQMPRI